MGATLAVFTLILNYLFEVSYSTISNNIKLLQLNFLSNIMMFGFTLLLSIMSYDSIKMPGFGSGFLILLSGTFYVLSSYLTHKLIGYLEL